MVRSEATALQTPEFASAQPSWMAEHLLLKRAFMDGSQLKGERSSASPSTDDGSKRLHWREKFTHDKKQPQVDEMDWRDRDILLFISISFVF